MILKYSIDADINNMGKFDRIKKALTIFDFEDELTKKFSENEKKNERPTLYKLNEI